MRKKKTLFFAGLVAFVCCFFGSVGIFAKSVSADTFVGYYLDVGTLDQFDATSDLWKGAPNDKDCYVKTNNKMNPGATYASALCFTAPCDGKIKASNSGSLGTVYQDIAEANISKSDGVRFSVFKNNTKIYPTTEDVWATVPQTSNNKLTVSYSDLEMTKGDKLYYIVDNGGNGKSSWDTTYLVMGFNWTSEGETNAVWFDSDKYRWTDEASGAVVYDQNLNYPKKDLLSYHYVSVLEKQESTDVETDNIKVTVNAKEYYFTELRNTPVWGGVPGRNADCYITENMMVPNEYYAAAICFTAPCDGRISNALGGGTIYRSGKVQANTDGTRFSVVLNDTIVYPFAGLWKELPTSEAEALEITFNSMDVKKGDKLWYVVDCGGNYNSSCDSNKIKGGFLWIDETNPSGVYVDFSSCYWTDETSGAEVVSFGNYKKQDVFSYHYVVLEEHVSVGAAEELSIRPLGEKLETAKLNYSQSKECYLALSDPKLTVYSDYCQPGDYDALGIVWKAPATGRIDLSNSWICNFNYHPELNVNGIRSDGIRIKIVLNGNQQIFPVEDEWMTITDAERHNITLKPFAVNQGDTLTFVLDNNGECNWDSCNYNIVIAFAEGDADYTNTYRNIIDYRADNDNAATWSYVAVMDAVDEEEQVIAPLPVVGYYTGTGCSGSVGNISLIIVAMSTIAVAFLRKKRSEKTEGEWK